MDKTEIELALKTAGGELPATDSDLFKEVVSSLILSWNIQRPQEIMLVNRMVATWMKMKKVEDMMTHYDLFFEKRNEKGDLIGVDINQMAYYLSKLESDFRAYYRTLQGKMPKVDNEVKDFHDLLKSAKPVKKK